MYVYRLPFCDCVHGKGQTASTEQRIPISLPNEQTWLATHHWLSWWQLCFRTLRSGWETMKRYPRPFRNWSSRESNRRPPHFISRGNRQILTQKNPLQEVGLLLWPGGRMHWRRRNKEILHPPSTASPAFKLSSKSGLPYNCITGYATTPPYITSTL